MTSPQILYRPRVRAVTHLPTGSVREALRPAAGLTAWGLGLLRGEPVEVGTRLDVVLRHADGGEQLLRGGVAGCRPAFGLWHTLDVRLDEPVMPLEWAEPFAWRPWVGHLERAGVRVGTHPRDPAPVLRVRPAAVGAMLVARPEATIVCDPAETDAPAGVDVLADVARLPGPLLRDLLGDARRDRVARRLLEATAADDWPAVRGVARGVRGYALGHGDDILASAARDALAAVETGRPAIDRQATIAKLVETLLVA